MLVVGIPSGQRLEQCIKTVHEWRHFPVKIALITWDKEYNLLRDSVDYYMEMPERRSFAINHNLLARSIIEKDNWSGYICGADDLYPGAGIHRLEAVCRKFDGRIIWVFDSINLSTMTHPVITNGYFKGRWTIFDEQFKHNFCDLDLMAREMSNIVRVTGITFYHRWKVNGEDEIYKMGSLTYTDDMQRYVDRHGSENIRGTVQIVDALRIEEL